MKALWKFITSFFLDLFGKTTHEEVGGEKEFAAEPEKEEIIREKEGMKITDNLLTPESKNRPGKKIVDVRAIAIHWVANPGSTPTGNRNWFEGGSVFGSTQYIVGIDGSVMRCIPDDEIAYHLGSSQPDPESGKVYTNEARKVFGEDVCAKGMVNYYAIGIELCHPDWTGKPSDATMASLKELVLELKAKFPKAVLITHRRTVGWKECPQWFCRNPDEWNKFCQSVGMAYERA